MKTDLNLIIGASGTVGSHLVSQLKHQGYRTRATTSKAVAPSEDLVHINLATGEGVHTAFEGVDRAFLLSPPGYADQHAMLSPLIHEAKRRGLKKVVLMTAMGANANEAAPFRKAELELEKSGLNYNIIRPNWFFQNFNTFWAQQINEHNKIFLPAGAAKVSFIDARDIASVAAMLLTTDQHNQLAFDLTGPDAIDHTQVAAALSKVTGRTIEYKEISPEALKSGLLGTGAPEDYANFLVMLFGFLREGYGARLTTSVKDLLGQQPRSLLQYVTDYKSAWIK